MSENIEITEQNMIIYDTKAMIDIADKYINEEVNGLVLPKNYDYKGAVSSLYLQCCGLKTSDGKLALEVCTPASIRKTVQDMIIKGLNPNKKQCYPIAYAVKDKDTKEVLYYELQLQESYFGKKKQAYTNNKELADNGINAQCIYKGDIFDTSIDQYGRKHITKHVQKFENIKDINIIGAYAVARFKDGTDIADVMTIEEIKKSWAMSKAPGTVHSNFSHEMACKTVSSRLAKQLSNATDDESLMTETENDDNADMVIDATQILNTEEIAPIVDNIEKEESNIVEPTEEMQPVEETADVNLLVCSACQKSITPKVSEYSVKQFGKPLCMNCQKEQK